DGGLGLAGGVPGGGLGGPVEAPGTRSEFEGRHGLAGAPPSGGAWGALRGPPSNLKQAQLRALRLRHWGSKPVELGERAKSLPDLANLALVVLHVLVRALRIPQARQLRVLVDGHVHPAARDVVRHLIPRLRRPTRPVGQLVGRRRRAGAGANLVAIRLDRFLER